jgi:hypothetical protein
MSPIADFNRSKSSNRRYQGRQYEQEDESYYQQRVNFAEGLKASGMSHNQAWFKAFQAYPRIYVDPPPLALDPSSSDPTDGNFVFPPRMGTDPCCSKRCSE